jgi:hypothetical protein
MFSDEKNTILEVVERFVQTGRTSDHPVNVVLLPDNKTSFVEKIGEEGRSVMLDEYRVAGKVIWAGYSGRSGTVYLSTAVNR